MSTCQNIKMLKGQDVKRPKGQNVKMPLKPKYQNVIDVLNLNAKLLDHFLTIISLERSMWETFGPKLYLFSVFSPRICFCFVKQYCIAGIAAFFEILLLAVSKHVLKRS